MKIGIDIDNVIANTAPIIEKYAIWYNENVVKRGLKLHENEGVTYKMFDWTKEENDDFCIKYLEEAVLQADVKDDAKEIIKRLRDEGHHINIISSRAAPAFKTPYGTTAKWLNERGIVYDDLLVGTVDKKEPCAKNHIDVLIDDEDQHIVPISEIIPVLVMDAPWNRQCEGGNTIRVHNWDEVYEAIMRLSA